jgi:hypothetical protein
MALIARPAVNHILFLSCEKKVAIWLDICLEPAILIGNMGEDFTIDYMTGFVFGILAFFGAYSFTVMFKAFRLPGDGA